MCPAQHKTRSSGDSSSPEQCKLGSEVEMATCISLRLWKHPQNLQANTKIDPNTAIFLAFSASYKTVFV